MQERERHDRDWGSPLVGAMFKRHKLEQSMFKILELSSTSTAPPIQIGNGFVTQMDALAALKRHLKTFRISGHNPGERYWWVRDSDGLRKCWISADE